MDPMKDSVIEWLMGMVLSAIFLTPVLAILNFCCPVPLPWVFVFVPWIGALHLLFCWFAGSKIARVLLNLFRLGSGR